MTASLIEPVSRPASSASSTMTTMMKKGILVRRRSSDAAKKLSDELDATGRTLVMDHEDEHEHLGMFGGNAATTATASIVSSSSDENTDGVTQSQEQQEQKTQRERRSNVRFSKIQVREYPITIGVNPSTEFGPALELGWKYAQGKEVDVDNFEQQRVATRRHGEEDLVLSSYQREEMLLEEGFTMRQIWNKTHEKDAYRRGLEKSKRKNFMAKLKNAFASIGADSKRKAIQKKNSKAAAATITTQSSSVP